MKYKTLLISILLDAIGMLSYAIPAIGEVSDVIWAPISAFIMLKLYKGKKGKIAAFISFMEEILPIDIIPTFTIMWVYTYLIQNDKNESSMSN
jgi:hypothetical protein